MSARNPIPFVGVPDVEDEPMRPTSSAPTNSLTAPHGIGVTTPSYPPAEIAELVELARAAFGNSRAISTSSTNFTGGNEHPAIFPADSILASWMEFSRAQEESADAFLIGAVLPVVAALLARRVWFQWGARRKYANLFVMLAGKPGDRKSSVILLADKLARRTLSNESFLPASFSPEAMFNEFAEEEGGSPDKLWIADDANAALKDWQKTANGERVATRFLELYDCKPLSESFQRNRKESADGSPRREVPETSTNLLFGATFNIAAFQGQEVRAGMARRFLYYIAERHGRLITRPQTRSDGDFAILAESFKALKNLVGEMDFTPAADAAWSVYQRMNREEMEELDDSHDAKLSRLSSAPMQTLSIAMIFESCRWAKRGGTWTGRIEANTLQTAIAHVDACLDAAERLDSTAHRSEIGQEAEILLARVRHDIPSVCGFHFASRSELTKRYCPNSGRLGSWKPDDLYLRFIPVLEKRGDARLAKKEGKREVFAFRCER